MPNVDARYGSFSRRHISASASLIARSWSDEPVSSRVVERSAAIRPACHVGFADPAPAPGDGTRSAEESSGDAGERHAHGHAGEHVGRVVDADVGA